MFIGGKSRTRNSSKLNTHILFFNEDKLETTQGILCLFNSWGHHVLHQCWRPIASIYSCPLLFFLRLFECLLYYNLYLSKISLGIIFICFLTINLHSSLNTQVKFDFFLGSLLHPSSVVLVMSLVIQHLSHMFIKLCSSGNVGLLVFSSARREGCSRGQSGSIASQIQWTWIWANSGR